MYKYFIFLALIITSVNAFSQQLSVPQLTDMLNWTPRRIDTTLRNDGYRLMQKDIDSSSSLFQYSLANRQPDGEAIVRSLTYMDVTVRNMKSRLITYRTYSKEEFQDMASWLLANNFKATNKFDFKEQQHILYSNGTQTIRVKIITTALKNGKTFIAYELELGK